MLSGLHGVNLEYTGEKAYDFSHERHGQTYSDRFRFAFKNIGALVMRVQLGQAQRAVLLQSISRVAYETNPAHVAGAGANERDVFTCDANSSIVRRVTSMLEEIAHYPIGRGKILNERTQPQKERNTEGLRGEEYLWDVLHAPVWSIGLNLAGQLHQQGFLYVCHPSGMSSAEYEHVTREIQSGEFKKIIHGNTIFILTSSGRHLETARICNLEISMDPEHVITKQPNGFVITYKNMPAPIGWMLHCGATDRLVEPQYTEDLLRVVRIARGGTHKLPKPEYHLLLENMRARTDGVRFTQNRTLNLLDDVVRVLEREYKFDPLKLISSTMNNSYKEIQKRMRETDVVEDLLTGILISEMVQHLKVTQDCSSRPRLPHEFSNTFVITQNNIKAFAYAYDICKPDMSPVFIQEGQTPFSAPEGELIDVKMNGRLQDPDLNNPKHIAALIATGILVAEQMILEQLLRDACKYGRGHPNAVALRKILVDPGLYNKLVKLAGKCPDNQNGPILGLQYPECEHLVRELRHALGFDCLAAYAEALYGKSGTEMNQDNMDMDALKNLFNIGKILQGLQGISVIDQHSRGINAGIGPVIRRLFPRLYADLMAGDLSTEHDPRPDKQKQQVITREPVPEMHAATSELSACPYFSRQRSVSDTVPVSGTALALTAYNRDPGNKNTWCRLFTRGIVITAAVMGITAAFASPYLKNN